MAPSASLSAQKRRNATALSATTPSAPSFACRVNAMRQSTQSANVLGSVSVMRSKCSRITRSTISNASEAVSGRSSTSAAAVNTANTLFQPLLTLRACPEIIELAHRTMNSRTEALRDRRVTVAKGFRNSFWNE